jgi:hypothetical protein
MCLILNGEGFFPWVQRRILLGNIKQVCNELNAMLGPMQLQDKPKKKTFFNFFYYTHIIINVLTIFLA